MGAESDYGREMVVLMNCPALLHLNHGQIAGDVFVQDSTLKASSRSRYEHIPVVALHLTARGLF